MATTLENACVILEENDSNIDNIDLSGRDITDEGAELISKLLKKTVQ